MSTSDRDMARDKAARLLKKRGSISSSAASNDNLVRMHKKHGSMSTISFMDEPGHDDHGRPPVKMENTYQLEPRQKFPTGQVRTIIQDVLTSYLQDENYEPDLCRQMTKTISEVVKARVKDMLVPRYKIICIIHIGQNRDQGMRIGSRCLWDPSNDTFASFEFKNKSLFAIGSVYGIYAE